MLCSLLQHRIISASFCRACVVLTHPQVCCVPCCSIGSYQRPSVVPVLSLLIRRYVVFPVRFPFNLVGGKKDSRFMTPEEITGRDHKKYSGVVYRWFFPGSVRAYMQGRGFFPLSPPLSMGGNMDQYPLSGGVSGVYGGEILLVLMFP